MALDTSVDQQATVLYEKEVQTFLSQNLHLLGKPSLELVQTEYPIKFGKDSGRIDVLAKDSQGDLVVIEVKRGIAGRSAVGQVQSYMGSLMTEYPDKKIRGLLVAMGLDEAARAALLVTYDVTYFEFKTRFEFSQVEIAKPEVHQSRIDSRAEVREGYWENFGGKLTDKVTNCSGCGKFSRVVIVGANHICGVCGKAIH
jgi:hypothetical protein